MSPDIRRANIAWESLLTAHTRLLRDFGADPVWKLHDLSLREYDVLYTLVKLDRPARVGELQSQVLLSQPALSRMLDRLVARQLIARQPDPSDKRAIRLTITPVGKELQRTVGRRHAVEVAQAVSERLTPEELSQLTVLTNKLSAPAPAHEGEQHA